MEKDSVSRPEPDRVVAIAPQSAFGLPMRNRLRWNPAQSEHDWRETGARFMDVQAARFMLMFM